MSKHFLKSRTVQSGIATILGTILTTIISNNTHISNYIKIDDGQLSIKVEHLVELATLIFTGTSGLYTIWNRVDPKHDNEILYTPKGLPGANKEDNVENSFEVLK